MMLEAFVPGLPVPQGSKSIGTRRDGRAFVFERTSATLKPWRQAVAVVAGAKHRGQPITGPVSVTLGFVLPKPASNRSKYPVGARTGDADKLARAVLDALAEGTGAGVFVNDSQVTSLTVTKMWCSPQAGNPEPGVWLRVRKVQE